MKKGETVTYTIKVENKGDATIPHVTDVIPAGLALQADSLPAECKADGQKVTCVAAKPLEKGQSFTYS